MTGWELIEQEIQENLDRTKELLKNALEIPKTLYAIKSGKIIELKASIFESENKKYISLIWKNGDFGWVELNQLNVSVFLTHEDAKEALNNEVAAETKQLKVVELPNELVDIEKAINVVNKKVFTLYNGKIEKVFVSTAEFEEDSVWLNLVKSERCGVTEWSAKVDEVFLTEQEAKNAWGQANDKT